MKVGWCHTKGQRGFWGGDVGLLRTHPGCGDNTRQPRFYLVSHGHPPSPEGMSIERMLRHRRYKGGRHLVTDSQAPNWGIQNSKSKPWRSSVVTSPKARHFKPLFLHLRFNWSRWRTPRGYGKSCSSA